MNQINKNGLSSVPPLPPRRTQSSIQEVTLGSVPPPPKQSKYLSSKDLIHFSTISEQNSIQLTKPDLRGGQINTYLPTNSFTNYSYTSQVTPIEINSKSLSSDSMSRNGSNFSSFHSNRTYSMVSFEDLKNQNSTQTKQQNNDLIDLMIEDNNNSSDCSILQLFDPLLIQSGSDFNPNLNFSNNFDDNFDHNSHEIKDEIDKSVVEEEEEEVIIRKNKTTEEEKEFISGSFRVKSKKLRANEELQDFCQQLISKRSQYSSTDFYTNIGLVISPTLESLHDNSLSVKLVIECPELSTQPICFTCNIDTSVEHIISHVICTLNEDASQVKMDEYMLKVYGLSEYFASDSVLANYSFVHECHKLDKDLRLTLIHIKSIERPFIRQLQDDELDFCADDLGPKSIICKFNELNVETINILLENFERETEKLREESKLSNSRHSSIQSQSIIQTVKAICSHLSSLETIQLAESCVNFSQLCLAFGQYKRESNIDSINNSTNIEEKLWEVLSNALNKLKLSLTQLIHLYSQTFPVDFEIEIKNEEKNEKKIKSISSSMDTLLCYIGVCCQLQPDWINTYKEFKIRLELVHGNNRLTKCHTRAQSPTKAFFQLLSFDEWIQFDWPIYSLPRESRLELTLIGIKNDQSFNELNVSPSSSSSPTITSIQENLSQELGFGIINLFDFKQRLVQSQYLIPLWINSNDFSIESDKKLINSTCLEKTNPIIHLIFPEYDFEIRFPQINSQQEQEVDNNINRRGRLNSLDSATQTELFQLLNRNPLEPMSCGEKEQLWDRRYYLMDCSQALPKVLLSSHSWEFSALNQIYSMVDNWTPLSALESIQLLMSSFPDIVLRQITVKWLKKLSLDELCDFLPQLIQSLRFDAYLNSPLIWFLLESSLTSVRICHHFYWLLKSEINSQHFSYRARIYLNSLLMICGEMTQNQFERQEKLCQQISSICDHVKQSKESQRLNTLLLELQNVNDFLISNPTPLPISPSMIVCGLDVKLCSYFPSNSLPLKLVFKNSDTKTSLSTLEAIFKVGDDLRQDMLSMQMIEIMDKFWLKSGLDLRMITFKCISTDERKGMVEMVRNSETLRKIQLEHGLTGSFKDRPIAEWLQKHNTSELEYRNAVDNFTYSCAGYSVASYILGLCDRHNDNIMLTTSGHLFHIDFGKFLGDSQTMAGIKRDRVAFVLTQDMAYVINGGDKPSKQFQFFIDLCCQAFNLLRKNGNFLLSLFELMLSSRICGLNSDAIKYIHRALMPSLNESEAIVQFTRMIEDSLRSRFTQFNFFIHNLAQLRFTGDHNDQLLLSFVPKKFTQESDGLIIGLEIIDLYKIYESEKLYFYVIEVKRQFRNQNDYIRRTYREFTEFHSKLTQFFPLAKFHPLARNSNLLLSRSNTRDVATQRMSELKLFLKGLMLLAHEISHSDIVYTFFHPLLRDQDKPNEDKRQTNNKDKQQLRRESLYGPLITGQIKVSIIYKNMSLIIMIIHAKNLQSPRSQTPDCYVKTYLNPDSNKSSKRKTRVIFKSSHPTFMEMIVYNGIPLEKVQQKTLQVSVWDYDRVTENVFLGAVNIRLRELQLRNETCDWFPLTGN